MKIQLLLLILMVVAMAAVGPPCLAGRNPGSINESTWRAIHQIIAWARKEPAVIRNLLVYQQQNVKRKCKEVLGMTAWLAELGPGRPECEIQSGLSVRKTSPHTLPELGRSVFFFIGYGMPEVDQTDSFFDLGRLQNRPPIDFYHPHPKIRL